MIKCEVIEKFDLKDFDKLKNIQRKSLDVKGSLFVGDTFECDKNMVDYLTGNNALNKVVVKVIEVKPEEVPAIEKVGEALNRIHESTEEKPKKESKKKTSKKSKK